MPQTTPPESKHASGSSSRSQDRVAWTQRADVRLLRNVVLPLALLATGILAWHSGARRDAAVQQAQAGLDRAARATGELLAQRTEHFGALLETLLAQQSTGDLLASWHAGDLDLAASTSAEIEASFERVLEGQPGLLSIELYNDLGKLFLSVAGGGEPLSPYDVSAEAWFESARESGGSYRWEDTGGLRITRTSTGADDAEGLLGSVVVDFDQLTASAAGWSRDAGSDVCLLIDAAARQVPLVGAPHLDGEDTLTARAPAPFLGGTLELELPLAAAVASFAPGSQGSMGGPLALLLGLLAALWIGLQQTVLGPLSTLSAASDAYLDERDLPEAREQPQGSRILPPLLRLGSHLWNRYRPGTRSLAKPKRKRPRPEDEISRVERALRSAVGAARRESATLRERETTLGQQLSDQEDRSSRREVDAQASIRARSAFLADLAGGLRKPLMSAVDAAERMLAEGAPGAELANAVQSEAAVALRILEQTRELAGLEAGRLGLSPSEADLDSALEELAEGLAELARPKGLEVVLDVDPDLPRRILLDGPHWAQALRTLAETLVQITDEGDILLRAHGAARSDSHVDLRFELWSAKGPIHVDALRRAFDPFGPGAGQAGPPTGPGSHPLDTMHLAIAAQWIRGMGGELEVASGGSEGTTLGFTGHFEVVEHGAPSLPAAAQAHLAGRRLLVVDDSAPSCRALATRLASWDLQPTLATNARDALAALAHAVGGNRPFDGVLIDRHMPGQDGVALARSIREQPQHVDLPLILLDAPSAASPMDDADAALFAGRGSKPLRAADLLQVLLSSLPEKAPEPEQAPALSMSASPTPMSDPTPTLAAPPAPEPAAQEAAAPESASPLHLEPQPEPQVDASAWIPEEPTRILLATSDGTLPHTLQHLGYDVVAVEGASTVQEVVDAEPFHALLLDVSSDSAPAFAAANRIRCRHDLRACLPIVGLTADDSQEERDRCIEAGMDDCIPLTAPVSETGKTLKRWVSVCSHLNEQELHYIAQISERAAALKRA